MCQIDHVWLKPGSLGSELLMPARPVVRQELNPDSFGRSQTISNHSWRPMICAIAKHRIEINCRILIHAPFEFDK